MSLVLLSGAQAAGLTNGGFETGTLSGWIGWPYPATSSVQTTTTAKEGTHYARINFTSLNTLIQDISNPSTDYIPGEIYTFSAWYKLSVNLPSAKGQMTLNYFDAQSNLVGNYNTTSGPVGPQSEWTKMLISFTALNAPTLRLSIRSYDSGAGTIAYDDVSIEEGDMIPNDLDIYLLMGQSNMYGFDATFNTTDTTPNAQIFMLNGSNAWVPAVEPLHGLGVGPGFAFARTMAAAQPTRNIGLVPLAVGQSPISSWVKNAINYNTAMARAQIAVSHGTIRGILWHQGEQDSLEESLAAVYETQFIGLINDIRADLGHPSLPFVAGELGRFITTQYRDEVVAAQQHVAATMPRVGFASSEDLPNLDAFHFNSTAQRVFGVRYAHAMLAIVDQPTSATHWMQYKPE